MSIDQQAVVQAFVRAAESGREREVEKVREPTVIISRTIGSKGDQIAEELAKRLGTDVYGSEILDSVAKQAKVDKKLLSTLNEFAGTPSDAWLFATVFGKNVTRDDYLNHLVTTVRGFHRIGGVILGRGAYIILENRPALRVRIMGSVDACAKRISDEDQIPLADAKRMVKESNRKRGKFVWDMFHRRLNDPANFDLIINTDKLPGVDAAVDIIIQALDAAGLNRAETVATAG
ncbi:MAG: cytidylate kinase-like family protein [Rhodospirillales bacterium]|nr:cytidylate kinase-like family protein [Rhodospirillales bacterium]